MVAMWGSRAVYAHSTRRSRAAYAVHVSIEHAHDAWIPSGIRVRRDIRKRGSRAVYAVHVPIEHAHYTWISSGIRVGGGRQKGGQRKGDRPEQSETKQTNKNANIAKSPTQMCLYISIINLSTGSRGTIGFVALGPPVIARRPPGPARNRPPPAPPWLYSHGFS